jgi:hypothetical protein
VAVSVYVVVFVSRPALFGTTVSVSLTSFFWYFISFNLQLDPLITNTKD